MKFVFALAVVAICVMLMNARPQVKRASDEVRVSKRSVDGNREHGSEVADEQKTDSAGEGGEETGEGNHLQQAVQKRSVDRVHGSQVEENQETKPEGEEGEEEEIVEQQDRRKKRAAADDDVSKWPENLVNLKFDEEYDACIKSTCKDLAKLVTEAAEEWTKMSGIDIKVDQSAKKNVLLVKNGDGCWAWIGYQFPELVKNVPQNVVVLQKNTCFHKGVILHEIGHALGLQHEVKRVDRDENVKTDPENMKPDMKDQFKKDPKAKGIKSSVPGSEEYDYCSIMHYSPTAFSKNGGDTITVTLKDHSKGENILPCLGSQIALSVRDGIGVAQLYGNLAGAADQKKCKNGGYKLTNSEKCCCSNFFKGDTCEETISGPGCGETTSIVLNGDEKKTFETPMYGKGNYRVNDHCVWSFSCTNCKICIALGGYDVEAPAKNGQCAFDWFEVADDEDETLKTKRYCGKKNTHFTKVFDGWVAIAFKSDSEYPAKGFKGEAYIVQDEADCQAIVEKATPNNYVDYYGYGDGDLYGY